jgi:glycosyltransferase involved in cell wall biosynthesis
LYFIVTPEDVDSIKVLKKLKQKYFVLDGEYCAAINYGVKKTQEPFIVCAADDVVFQPGWDSRLFMMALQNPSKNIFGGIDSWKVSKTLIHISHPMVRRSYIKGNLYYPDYIHYNEDVELIQRGWKEGCVLITPEILIEHPHPYAEGKTEEEFDDTYKRSMKNCKHDGDIYNRRKGEFEMVDYDYLHRGLVIPTKLNPLYNQTLLSIVIPTYNDADFLKGCLLSIAKNTYYKYEIIIIDNGSDEIQKTGTPWDMINTKELLEGFQLEDQSCSIKVIRWDKNRWINPAWNYGAKIAKGQYIVYPNADITVSYHWDKFLVAALEMPDHPFTISCPYETNPGHPQPFMLDAFFMKNFPKMLKGPCFMFRKADVPKLFPIPTKIKHWCGDNVLADRANALNGICFINKAQIHHFGTQAGKRIPVTKYTDRVYADMVAYEKWSGKSMVCIKERFPQYWRDLGIPPRFPKEAAQ